MCIPHLLFADDLLFFNKENVHQVVVVSDILNNFCLAFGQIIKTAKSVAYASKQVSSDTKQTIHNVTGIHFTNENGKYLGIPLVNERV